MGGGLSGSDIETTEADMMDGVLGQRAPSEVSVGDVAFSPDPALSPTVLKQRLMIADAGALIAGFAAAFALQRGLNPVPGYIAREHFLLGVGSFPAFAVGALLTRLHQARANERPSDERLNILRAVTVGVAFMVLLSFALQYDELSRLWVGLVGASTAGALVLERYVARRVFVELRSTNRICRRIVVVGTDAHAIGLAHTYQRHPELGYHVVGFVGEDDIGERGGARMLGTLEDVADVLAAHDAVGVVVSLSGVSDGYVNRITRSLTDAGYHVSLSSSLTDIDVGRLRPQSLDGRTMIYVEPVVRDGVRGVAKRCFDVALATVILLATLPVLVAAVVAIKLDSRGPVLFRQRRVGRSGEPFTMIKFRTMVVDAEAMRSELGELNEADGPLFKMQHDPRITRVGRYLRKFSIDELPQLWSVLRGDMSMVGPRPALPEEVDHWEPELHERLRVLPGLTGLWQISGRSDAGFEQYRRLDLYYVHNWSLGHDLRICVRTVGVVLTGRGAV